MRKGVFIVVILGMLVCACGNRMSSEKLQHKLDSVKAIEDRIRLQAQGIHLDVADPMSLFLDSMEVMALPLEGSSDEPLINSSFKDVPSEAYVLMHIIRPGKMKAVMMPDKGKTRLMLMTGEDDIHGGDVTYLYTFDMGYQVKDSLCLSRITDLTPPQRGMKTRVVFAVMSNYQIILSKYFLLPDTDTPTLLGIRGYRINKEGYFMEIPLTANQEETKSVSNTLPAQ